MKRCRVIIRGGGDIATGVAHKLKRCGMEVIVLECEKPMAIRRKVAFSEAVYENKSLVEGITGVLVSSLEDAVKESRVERVPILVDPKGKSISELKPHVVVDAIIAKKNIGTEMNMAPVVIALGPGFTAGSDCHVVVETMRGHDLGRLIYNGQALANTGNPGSVGGYSLERVIHSPSDGILKAVKAIGDTVLAGEVLAYAGETEVKSQISGIIRGMLHDGIQVRKGLKMADVDPRADQVKNCYTISDKARCIGGSVLEAIMAEFLRKKEF
ncbi:selenium-dependent molybdenum cofactor biosynthesis protein YqeB [uncultured Ilyobacter sp.]|uniref:selenium-dependent molybdenum cofactor biosynthesis protein YqeB n=1 Tax=uncultured Ilyobacter sp. TaxID=544433 RepID=UPI0029C66F8F|nr:selenium-dependent molybdenum cofactor biosynthesis protein YqeB [uncultured Ilyobacter sp.]